MDNQKSRKCLECDEKIVGRVDKKFCCDQCRINYNNRLNSNENNYVRNINSILRRNRRILMELNKSGKSRTHKDRLSEKGFDFNHFTSTYKTKEGALYMYCYEQGYLSVDANWYLLVVKKDFTN